MPSLSYICIPTANGTLYHPISSLPTYFMMENGLRVKMKGLDIV